MDDDDREQDAIHEALASAIDFPEDAVLTGWCLVYEYRTADNAAAGVERGPGSLTAWQAIGLLEWGRIVINGLVEECDDDGE